MIPVAVILSFLTIFNGSDFALAQASRTKLCSVVVPDNWRDTISVPSGESAGVRNHNGLFWADTMPVIPKNVTM